MQETVIEQLLDIYAHSQHNQVHTDVKYCEIYDKYNSNDWFTKHLFEIEKIKRWIEDNVESKVTVKNRMVECLRLLRKRKANDDTIGYKYALTLILKMYSKDWTRQQKKHFENVCCVMDNCRKDYFLSFTNRRAIRNELDMLHQNHKYFIKYILGIEHKDWLKKAKENKNLLAEAIHQVLSYQLKGFYFPLHEEDNSVVEQKLEQSCKACFTLVQLVQNILFEKTAKKNYCHCEYLYSKEGEAIPLNRRLYILAEKSHDDLVKSDIIPDEYDEWLEEIRSKDKVQLDYTDAYNSRQILDLKKKIIEKVAKRIRNERERLFEMIPD